MGPVALSVLELPVWQTLPRPRHPGPIAHRPTIDTPSPGAHRLRLRPERTARCRPKGVTRYRFGRLPWSVRFEVAEGRGPMSRSSPLQTLRRWLGIG